MRVDGGSMNSNVFDWRDGMFSARNFRTSASVRCKSIGMHSGVEISGKRSRIIVDDDIEHLNRFRAMSSSRCKSRVSDSA